MGLNADDMTTSIIKTDLRRALMKIRLTDIPYMFTKGQNGGRRNVCFHDLLWRALEDAREKIIDLFENGEPELLVIFTELQDIMRDKRKCLICPS